MTIYANQSERDQKYLVVFNHQIILPVLHLRYTEFSYENNITRNPSILNEKCGELLTAKQGILVYLILNINTVFQETDQILQNNCNKPN